MVEKKEIHPAATLILLRESAVGLETLLLQRHSKSRVGSGAWVFPGGVVESEDHQSDDLEQIARFAASRETFEEAGLTVATDTMQFVSHWTTPDAPEISPKRFSTWFFLSGQEVGEVVIDGQEIDDFRWCSPEEALLGHQERGMTMLPPTVVTLTELLTCSTIAEANRFYASRIVPYILPRMAKQDDQVCMLYPGDAGYDSGIAATEGMRNRSWRESFGWRYEFA